MASAVSGNGFSSSSSLIIASISTDAVTPMNTAFEAREPRKRTTARYRPSLTKIGMLTPRAAM